MTIEAGIDAPAARPELWGGIECTIARIGDRWRNQIDEIGLVLDDAQLRAIAALGLRRLRFPLLWETVSPDDPAQCDWRWHDARLAALREIGLPPIAGLVHHGSGPYYTDLLDDRFPDKLAAYARRAAERYPWIDAWTPVNEPLTTARFSALYGHWYPHRRDIASCLRALVHQCRATVRAMAEIRRVNPAAQLVQTEDLGRTYATPRLQYQADYENERRWLSFDLLLGRVDRAHPLYRHLLDCGIATDDLDSLRDNAIEPDLLGVNHYLTGERYLDERLDRYPAAFHGGNGRDRYADVEAVRVAACAQDVGPHARLRELWQRYRRPFAVTEAHHGCSREEQARWLVEVWDAACALKCEGADVRAVTVWSLYGARDWNTLLVADNGHYEAGAFDARSTPPRPTLIARTARSLATDGCSAHPVFDTPGWWRRDDRFLAGCDARVDAATVRRDARPVLVTGGTGTLGRAFSQICARRGLAHRLVARRDMDIADPTSVRRMLETCRPWAVINAAGYVRVADAELERERCFRENLLGAEALAAACAEADVPLVTFSSDLVFDGVLGRPYVESDVPSPCCTYGSSKAEAERCVLAACADALVVRTSAFFGPWDRFNFVHGVIARLVAGEPLAAADNVVVSPTYVPDLVHATLDLLLDGERGLRHLANRGAVTWYELAVSAAEALRLPRGLIERRSHPRAASTVLGTERGCIMPALDSALARYMRERDIAVA